MNQKDRMILEEYRKSRNSYVKMGEIVVQILQDLVDKAGFKILGIEHRVKTQESLAGKLLRRGDWLQSLSDLTDILGARIICFFADEVDAMGKLVEQAFVIDWENSSDKRADIQADAFGYLSLHYCASLPRDAGYPDEVCGKRFEIQIRTNLQHTWSAIYHDLGYKSEFGVPRVVVREFARLAGLLELADDEFIRARDKMNRYTEEIRGKIINDRADDVAIDVISLREYIARNKRMRGFLDKLAAFSGAELETTDAEPYIEQLLWLGKKTIGDLSAMVDNNEALALALAEGLLKDSELDILSTTVGLRYLCRAELLNRGFSQEQAVEFFKLSTGNEQRAQWQAKSLFDSYRKLLAPAHD